MKGWCICFIINLLVCSCINAQLSHSVSSNTLLPAHDTAVNAHIASIITLNIPQFSNAVIKPVPATFYFTTLGFFCKKELQAEKVLKFPLKLRLGSVAYTDQMEGKGKRNNF